MPTFKKIRVRNTGKGEYQRLSHTDTSLNQINSMNLMKGKKPKRTPNTTLDIALLGNFSHDRQSEGIRTKQNKNTDLGTKDNTPDFVTRSLCDLWQISLINSLI